MVTVELRHQNTGSLNLANLVATLQATGGVMPAKRRPQTYGVVVAGVRPFSSPLLLPPAISLAATLVASLALQDGASNLGTITYHVSNGNPNGASLPRRYSSGNSAICYSDQGSVDIPERSSDTRDPHGCERQRPFESPRWRPGNVSHRSR